MMEHALNTTAEYTTDPEVLIIQKFLIRTFRFLNEMLILVYRAEIKIWVLLYPFFQIYGMLLSYAHGQY